MWRVYIKEILAVLFALAVVGGSFVLGRALAPESAFAQNPCPDTAGETIICWENFYHEQIEGSGSITALKDLKIRYESDAHARTFCHPLLHIIGEAAGREFGSVAKAYLYGETFCRSGYYHGVLEGIFGAEGGEKLLHELDSVCAEVRGKERYSYDYFSCVHGIGHGLMAYFDHDLFESLKGCGKLSGSWEQSSCAGGVFMENIISHSEEMPSKYLKKDDPVYPCNAVDDGYRSPCFQMQTSHMLTLFNGDFSKTFSMCREVEKKYRTTCFESIGRDVSGYSGGSEEYARALCSIGATRNERAHCFLGAAVDYIQSVGHEAARSLCAQEEDGVSEICSAAVEWHLRAL